MRGVVPESLNEREGAARTRGAVGGWFDECTVGLVSVTKPASDAASAN